MFIMALKFCDAKFNKTWATTIQTRNIKKYIVLLNPTILSLLRSNNI